MESGNGGVIFWHIEWGGLTGGKYIIGFVSIYFQENPVTHQDVSQTLIAETKTS